ncbi:MAG: TatA/E family twin arginine-targeting protein translocase [Cyanobacteriota bacterium]|jgi:sec-independent protein translocase protein TatA
MNIFGIGLPEMAVIAAIALLVFGPKRLPEMGKSLGRTLKGFQTASQEFEQEFRSALRTPEDAVPPSPAALAAPSAAAALGPAADEEAAEAVIASSQSPSL